MYREAKQCRICGNPDLLQIIDLGEQYLTGVFPPKSHPQLLKGPVQLLKCCGKNPDDFCGLVQLRHTFPAGHLYGEMYGYRSGLNPAMVRHLHRKTEILKSLVQLGRDDLVLDIGSNDGTLLAAYPDGGPTLVGMDPSARKFRKYYRPDIQPVADFFSADKFRARFGDRKAKIITSIAMFYDLEQPQTFVDDIAAVLAADGLWHFEQSYLPSMIEANSYDTICHEHIEYYTLRQIDWMMRRVGLRIIEVQKNNTNGGSFAVTAAHEQSGFKANQDVDLFRLAEAALALDTMRPFEAFQQRVIRHREEIRAFFLQLQQQKKKIVGYGASTKGNVLLQFCGITPEMLPCIGEINEDKFGCVTPGTWIPILPEQEMRAMKPDYFFVLPWHFRAGIIEREAAFLAKGGKLVFPLPRLEALG
jgi:NDP-4-keto-2,6-dideoxyhexose 3-C-methyltransferase